MQAILFPGQGSQFKGMGKALFPQNKSLTKSASAILGYSIEELCLSDPHNQLGQTDFTQPALFVVNAMSFMAKQSQHEAIDSFAGHSLGEYNALFAAGAFDFETGMKLVQKRGQLMAQAKGGGMLAVLQTSVEAIHIFLREHHLTALDIANYNTPTQTILSGPKEAIAKAVHLMGEQNIRCMPLNVSAPFHSRYMMDAMAEFETFVAQFQFAPLKVPVIANVTARPYTNTTIASLLTRQIASSVRWTESVRYLMGQAALRNQPLTIQEMGDHSVLSKMVVEIQKSQSSLLVPTESSADIAPVSLAASDMPQFDAAPAVRPVTDSSMNGNQASKIEITPESLGSAEFRKDYGIKYAYLSGAMYRGIASKELVVAMGKAGLLGFLGTGGMSVAEIQQDLAFIQSQLTSGQSYGMNLLCNLERPEMEMATVELFLQQGVRCVEASAFMQMTPALVLYRLRGLSKNAAGKVDCTNRIIGKISRPEVAEHFMSPAPERIVSRLREEGRITVEQAALAKCVPMSDDICVEADSGGHTDQGVSTVLLPAMQNLRSVVVARHAYEKSPRIGLAGGIGTPSAVAAAFIMGADFVLTGSINQCTVESGASSVMKDILQDMNVQDTDYAPAGDMFEIGARVQVLKKGVFFPARANKLYALYTQYNGLDDIPEKIKAQIEDKYFKRSFASIWDETRQYWASKGRQHEIDQTEANPKRKMAWVFRWYFRHSAMVARKGDESQRVDFQIHTGPALGAFNQLVKGTALESWKNRHVDQIALMLMHEAAVLLTQRLSAWGQKSS